MKKRTPNICPFQDDDGKFCTNVMSKDEKAQDGMCSRCASLLWDNFYHPHIIGREPKHMSLESNFAATRQG